MMLSKELLGHTFKARQISLIIASSVLLAGCGGGGGGSSYSPGNPSLSPTPSPGPGPVSTINSVQALPGNLAQLNESPVSSSPAPKTDPVKLALENDDGVDKTVQPIYPGADPNQNYVYDANRPVYQRATFVAQGTSKDDLSKMGYDGTNVKVGVSDSGTDFSDPIIQKMVGTIPESQQLNLVEPGQPLKDYTTDTGSTIGHGTAVLYTIMGKSNQLTDGGIAPKIMPYVASVGTSGNYFAAGTEEWQWFANNGVGIVNNSWGSPSNNGEKASDSIDASAAIIKPYVDQGMLFVFAAGNQGLTQPGIGFVRTPIADASLQKGLIVVTGVNLETEGKGLSPVVEASSTASECGNTAQWCLTGVNQSYIVSTNKSDTAWTVQLGDGTSFAAPSVTAAAALVKQKYPWADNDFLRTALLTTANDIGAPGVDPVYGWGLLNINKALNGPAQLAFGDLSTNVTEGTYDLSNNMSGSGGLIKNGPGTLNLSGTNTYTGENTVNDGTLSVSGSLVAKTNVNELGTLASGAVLGSIVNKGHVLSNGMVVNGDFTQTSTGLLVTPLDKTLVVNGSANLAGSLSVTKPAATFVQTDGTTTDLITTQKNVNGRFDQVQSTGLLYDVNLNYEAQKVVAQLKAKSVAAVASSAQNGSSTIPAANSLVVLDQAHALDNLTANSSNTPKASGTEPTAEAAGAISSPKAIPTATQSALAQVQNIQTAQQLNKTLETLNASVYGNALIGLLNEKHNDQQSAALAWQDVSSKPSLSVTAAKTNSNIGSGDQSAKVDGNSYRLDYTQAVGSNGAVNLVFNRFSSGLDQNDLGINSSAKIKSTSGQIGYRIGQANGWYGALGAGYSDGSIDAKRGISLNENSQTQNTGKTQVKAYSLMGQVGYIYPLSANWKVGGFLGLNNDWVTVDGLQEQGDLALTLNRKNLSLLNSMTGLYTQWLNVANSGVDVSASYIWQHAFYEAPNLDGMYVGGDVGVGAQAFTNRKDTHSFRVQAGFSPIDNLALYLGYSRQAGAQKQNQVDAKAAYRF